MPITLTKKQNEYIRKANHRWNFKVGATGSGKTFMDTAFTIPYRIRERRGKSGLVVLIGNTKGTLQRNIISPLQEIYTTDLVGDINSQNISNMFGQEVYCLGADKVNQVSKIQGSTIKYCYGDEMTTWNEEVFEMLKSRLRTECSLFDGTMNPASPKHFMKEFIDSDADIYCQHYTIDDNPTLPKEFVRQLKKEYEGTVYYDWYILGKWSVPSGIIFPMIAKDKAKYIIPKKDIPTRFQWVEVGEDFGGNGSAYAMTCTAMGYDGNLYVLKSQKKQAEDLAIQDVEKFTFDFIDYCENKYKLKLEYANCDHIDTIINTLNNTRYMFGKCYKPPLEDRVFLYNKLFAQDKIKFVDGECDDLIEEFQEIVADDRQERLVPLDDGTNQIDAYDSFTYSISNNWNYIID